MKNMIVKILVILFAVVFFALLAFTVFYCIRHDGKIREYKDANGNPLPGSISEKLILPINGANNGLFINSTNDRNPVLLLVSSGPGTDDYFFNEKYPDFHLEDEFTICYWDYRGMGIVYDKNIDPASIDLDTLVDDAVAVTNYLRERFNKEKIYIMGYSGGTTIAIPTISRYPELYYAYIGMAQVVSSGPENDTLIYNFVKDIFTGRNDKRRLKKLDQAVEFLDNGMVKCKSWADLIYLLHDAGGGTTLNETEFEGICVPIMLAHCYTVKESYEFIRGMYMYRTTTLNKQNENIDYRKDYPEFEIPVYFLSGNYDYNCPWPLVEEYCNMLKAPDKHFYLVENAAHSPLWEQQAVSYDIMKEIKEKTNGK